MAALQSVPGVGALPPYTLSWQSKVGFLPWMGPSTAETLKGLAGQGHRAVLLVPVAFTSDHVETLFEIDQEYAEEARAHGITRFERAPSLNGEPLLSDALASLVGEHLASGAATATPQYAVNCAQCVNPTCRTIINPVAPYTKLRDAASADATRAGEAAGKHYKPLPVWPSPADVDTCRSRGEVPHD